MKRVLILVEGQTEERFVKDVLRDHLFAYDVWITPTILTTKRVKCGPDFKGGVTSYAKVKRESRRLLGDTSAALVTTMFDLYALPRDFPGRVDAGGDPLDKARHIEQAFTQDIGDPRFAAHLSLHEFEGMLFAEPPQIAKALNDPRRAADLQRIRDGFTTPEDINDDRRTAPSKRIAAIFPAYSKTLYGALIARRIGLRTIRRECPHFSKWLTMLEHL
ncbi:MAG: DUF4276 family protein [Planctomycetota bacterium]